MSSALSSTNRLFVDLFDVVASRLGNRRAAAAVSLVALRRGGGARAERALVRLEHASELGCGWSTMALAQAYARGYGVEKDVRRSIGLLAIAAAAGHRTAMTTIADCYASGVVVPKDPAQAAAWERLAQQAMA